LCRGEFLNRVSQTRVVSHDESTVFHQKRANSAERLLDGIHVAQLMRVFGRANWHPWSAASQISHQSDVRVLRKVLRGVAVDKENAEFAKKLALRTRLVFGCAMPQ
jgi:hypothetical protein